MSLCNVRLYEKWHLRGTVLIRPEVRTRHDQRALLDLAHGDGELELERADERKQQGFHPGPMQRRQRR